MTPVQIAEKQEAQKTARSSWTGLVKFGFVTFPVQAFNALRRGGGRVRFHQLHKLCHSRIRHEKACPIHGVAPNDEIVSGYEYEEGKFVEIEADELRALQPEREQVLRIDNFVPPDEIDPVYFDGRRYFLLPSGGEAREAYYVFHDALERQGLYGVGQVFFAGREQLAVLRPLDGVLEMAFLNYPAEVLQPYELAPDLERLEVSDEKVHMAETLIEAWSRRDFDFSEYIDKYGEQVDELIKRKIAGKATVLPPVREEEPGMIDLLDAILKTLSSLEETRGAPKAGRMRSTAKRRGAKRR